jgi:hypothetical protein
MFEFFRNSQGSLLGLMKVEIDGKMLNPYTTKLNFIQVQVLTFTQCLVIGLHVGLICGIIFFFLSITDLVVDYKTRILEARRGVFWDFHLDKIEVSTGADMPGLLISNSIMSYFLVTGSVTLVIALICYPLFWAILWSFVFIFIPIFVSGAIDSFIDGYITD